MMVVQWLAKLLAGADLAYTTVYEELRPTFAHEALAKLVEMGKTLGTNLCASHVKASHISGVVLRGPQVLTSHGAVSNGCTVLWDKPAWCYAH